MAAMEDDLNAPKALALTWEALRSGELSAAEKWDFLQKADTILALDLLVAPEKESAQALPAAVQ
ncbi:MAG: cysteine--tRNA ligase, partial [Elusimicrobiaceae bacterium]|nr:cysteine--tRNA ligase [Elusimicrobiaceae bacterium]